MNQNSKSKLIKAAIPKLTLNLSAGQHTKPLYHQNPEYFSNKTGFILVDFREFILIDYKEPESEIRDEVKSLKRGASNSLILFNPELNDWDKLKIKLNQIIFDLKENLVKAKTAVEENLLYQKIVQVFQINSFLTKGYFMKFLV